MGPRLQQFAIWRGEGSSSGWSQGACARSCCNCIAIGGFGPAPGAGDMCAHSPVLAAPTMFAERCACAFCAFRFPSLTRMRLATVHHFSHRVSFSDRTVEKSFTKLCFIVQANATCSPKTKCCNTFTSKGVHKVALDVSKCPDTTARGRGGGLRLRPADAPRDGLKSGTIRNQWRLPARLWGQPMAESACAWSELDRRTLAACHSACPRRQVVPLVRQGRVGSRPCG